MARTYGSVKYDATEREWLLSVDPHIAMKLKRWFTRSSQHRTGEIVLVDSLDTALDLQWILGRYPMIIGADTLARIDERAEECRARGERVARVLSGDSPHLLQSLEPARPPRSYQVTAGELCATTGRLLVTDELGLGKTFSGLLVLAALDALPALVVTLTPLPRQWLGELVATWPMLRGHIVTSGQPYDVAARCRGVEPDVLIMNYQKMAGWCDVLAGVVRTVIFDEMQELRHDGTQKYAAASMLAHQANYRMGLTATPVYNYGGEIYNVMNVLDPEALGDKAEFAREWCAGGTWLDGKTRVNNPESLTAHLRDSGLMLHRTRVEVGRELPDVIPVIESIDIDDDDLEARTEDITEFARLLLEPGVSNTARWHAATELDWRLRMATGMAKAKYVAAFVKMLLDAGETVLLFGWHHDVYDVWKDKLGPYRPAMYMGEQSDKQKHASKTAFLDGDTNLLIMSLRAGAGLDGLQARCKTAVFGELDWAPGVHDQCVGRLHRDGQNDPVLAYYLVAESGSDPVIAETLNLKRAQSVPINTPDAARIIATPVDQSKRMKVLAREFLLARGIDPDTLVASDPPARRLALVPPD